MAKVPQKYLTDMGGAKFSPIVSSDSVLKDGTERLTDFMNDRNLKSYTSLEQLGLSKTSTVEEVVNRIPQNSILYLKSYKELDIIGNKMGIFGKVGSLVVFHCASSIYALVCNADGIIGFKLTTEVSKVFPNTKEYEDREFVVANGFTCTNKIYREYKSGEVRFKEGIQQDINTDISNFQRVKIIEDFTITTGWYPLVPVGYEYKTETGGYVRALRINWK